MPFFRGTFLLTNTELWVYIFTKVGRHTELWVYILRNIKKDKNHMMNFKQCDKSGNLYKLQCCVCISCNSVFVKCLITHHTFLQGRRLLVDHINILPYLVPRGSTLQMKAHINSKQHLSRTARLNFKGLKIFLPCLSPLPRRAD